jgi:sporadic carbohydrate cluster 2OG-Fe(II) oxygenase
MKNLNFSKIFYSKGYVIGKIENINHFQKIEKEISKITLKFLNIKKKPIFFLENLHKYLDYEKINVLRVKIYKELNQKKWFREIYFNLAKKTIKDIVGDELAMQNNINFSFQLPKDSTSQLSMHSDSLSGESMFQVVLWVPLMKAHKTNSMYILNKKDSIKNIKNLKNFQYHGIEKIYHNYKKKIEFLNVKKNQFLLFSPNLLHGNVVNEEKTTRISMNCRFKNLFSPYNNNNKHFGKRLGYFYSPLKIKSVTKFSLDFKIPNEF